MTSRVGIACLASTALVACAPAWQFDGLVRARPGGAPIADAAVLLTCDRPGSIPFGIETTTRIDGAFSMSRTHSTFLATDCTARVMKDGYATRRIPIAEVCIAKDDGDSCRAAHADVTLDPLVGPH